MEDRSFNKVKSLLHLIKDVDGRRISSPMSDYSTVNDILNKLENGNKLTSSQLNLIESINKLYIRRHEKS